MYILNKQFFAFNIWDIDSIQAVMDAADETGCDVILQTSSRIFESMEQNLIRSFVTYYNKKTGINAYLHLDHCRDIELAKKAVDSEWDSVMLDASHLHIDENIRLTNILCSYAHPRGVLVEAEVGCIQGVEDDIISDHDTIADLNEIQKFLNETNIDLFAAAIGTCHGLYKKAPNIRYELIEKIKKLSDKPFVIHGGSGLKDEDFIKLLSYPNVRKINISTELKQAYRRGILKASQKGLLEHNGFEVPAVKKEIYIEIKETASHKLRLLKEEKH